MWFFVLFCQYPSRWRSLCSHLLRPCGVWPPFRSLLSHACPGGDGVRAAPVGHRTRRRLGVILPKGGGMGYLTIRNTTKRELPQGWISTSHLKGGFVFVFCFLWEMVYVFWLKVCHKLHVLKTLSFVFEGWMWNLVVMNWKPKSLNV